MGFCLLTLSSQVLAIDPQIKILEEKAPFNFESPEIKIHEFSSGAKLYYLENKELPIVEMDAMVKIGTIHDPQDKKGLLNMLAYGLRTGGTKKYKGEEIDRQLENAAMDLSVNAGAEVSFVSIKSLKRDEAKLFDLFFEVLHEPVFDADKIELGRKQMLQALARRNENPMAVAKREFLQRLYGTQNVWARTAEESTIQNITRDDLVSWHKAYFAPNNFWFVVTGDISFEEAKKNIETHLSNWERSTQVLPEVSAVEKEWDSANYLINKDVKQSAVVMGHFGEKRFNPDKYALTLANYMLGGSTFGSRLGNWIRTSLGLAYGINSSFGLGSDYGPFTIAASTSAATTVQMISEIKKTMKEISGLSPFNRNELDKAKKAILNQLVFENDEPAKIVRARRFYDYYGYPADYLSVYQKEIQKTTLEQVNAAFKKYIDPNKLIVLIVGNKKGIENLQNLGTVIDQPLDND